VSVAIFELGGALAPAIPDLAIGPWRSAPPEIAAFDAGADPLESRWRVDLARDDAASRAEFAAGERSVAQTHAVLDEVPRRLDRALDREADLLAALAHAAPRRTPADVPGAAPHEPHRLEHTLEHTLGCIADLARGRARIETHVGGTLVAHSIMTLSGDTELWATPRLSLADARLHARSVAVAVRTRHAWARILTLVLSGCGRILTLGLPAAGISALPLVWRFVRDLLREVRPLDAAPHPAG
jgi:hypothetical protein